MKKVENTDPAVSIAWLKQLLNVDSLTLLYPLEDEELYDIREDESTLVSGKDYIFRSMNDEHALLVREPWGCYVVVLHTNDDGAALQDYIVNVALPQEDSYVCLVALFSRENQPLLEYNEFSKDDTLLDQALGEFFDAEFLDGLKCYDDTYPDAILALETLEFEPDKQEYPVEGGVVFIYTLQHFRLGLFFADKTGGDGHPLFLYDAGE